MSTSDLKSGKSKRCFSCAKIHMRNTKHLKKFGRDFNEVDQNLASRWRCLRQRCYNPKHPNYPVYGGRGIIVSDEFRDDVVAFVDYIRSLPGFSLKLTLDRIDPDRGYERGNLRWATRKQQSRNLRTCTRVGGESARDFCDRHNIPSNEGAKMLSAGMPHTSLIDEFNTRKKKHRRKLFIEYENKEIPLTEFKKRTITFADQHVRLLSLAGLSGEEIIRRAIESKRSLRYRKCWTETQVRDPEFHG